MQVLLSELEVELFECGSLLGTIAQQAPCFAFEHDQEVINRSIDVAVIEAAMTFGVPRVRSVYGDV
jgi:hypothetical protein